jgi:hypothetical protein
MHMHTPALQHAALERGSSREMRHTCMGCVCRCTPRLLFNRQSRLPDMRYPWYMHPCVSNAQHGSVASGLQQMRMHRAQAYPRSVIDASMATRSVALVTLRNRRCAAESVQTLCNRSAAICSVDADVVCLANTDQPRAWPPC